MQTTKVHHLTSCKPFGKIQVAIMATITPWMVISISIYYLCLIKVSNHSRDTTSYATLYLSVSVRCFHNYISPMLNKSLNRRTAHSSSPPIYLVSPFISTRKILSGLTLRVSRHVVLFPCGT